MKFNPVGIPTIGSFDGEIPLPHLKGAVSNHLNNPFGIQRQRYLGGAPYPDLVKTVRHVAFEVDDLAAPLAFGYESLVLGGFPDAIGVLSRLVAGDWWRGCCAAAVPVTFGESGSRQRAC
jgi:hypothetical protein